MLKNNDFEIFFQNSYGNLDKSKSSRFIIQLNILRDFFCYVQNDLLQYVFITSEKHKKIKNILSGTNDFDEISKEDLKKAHVDLEDYLYVSFDEVSKKSFDILIKYFFGRSKIVPRFCIKALHKDIVRNLFRSTPFYSSEYGENVDDNTGLQELFTGKKYFLCNDIPTSIKERIYFNRRIDSEKAYKYRSPNISDNIWRSRFKDDYDKEWIKCWNHNDDKNFYESCYKSTLIIPMSFMTDALDEEFKGYLKIGKETKQIICGFLCLDHMETFFFEEQPDVSMGYIVADILSIYLMYQLIYTQYSTVFYNSKSIIS